MRKDRKEQYLWEMYHLVPKNKKFFKNLRNLEKLIKFGKDHCLWMILFQNLVKKKS